MLVFGVASAAPAAVIEYSSRFGDSDTDAVTAMAVDADGNRYIVGSALAPATPPNSRNIDILVAKVNVSGELVFANRIGGFGDDRALGLAVDLNGRMFIVGETDSEALPATAGALQPVYRGAQDGFLAIVGADGELEYMTYLGGTAADSARAVALDQSGDIYVAGSTASNGFPGIGSNALQPQRLGQSDGFVVKIANDVGSFVWGTYIGGSSTDAVNAIAVDLAGQAYIAGVTASPNYPMVADATPVQGSFGGAGDASENPAGVVADAFVSKLSADGRTLVYSTYLGGSNMDGANAIAVDFQGAAYVTGYTSSVSAQEGNLSVTGFPVRDSSWQTNNGGGTYDAFVAKLDETASNLLWSTYFGGPEADEGRSIAINDDRQVFIGGTTAVNAFSSRCDRASVSVCFPLLRALQHEGLGGSDGFVAQFDVGGDLLFASYLGGSGEDGVGAVAIGGDRIHAAGVTASADFPAVGEPLPDADTGGAFLTVLDTTMADEELPDIRVDVGAVDVNSMGEAFPVPENEIARFRVSAENLGPGEVSGVMVLVRLSNARLAMPLPQECEALDEVSAVCRIVDPDAGEPLQIGARPRSMGTVRMTATLQRANQSDRVAINNSDVENITIVDTSGSKGSLDRMVLLALALMLMTAGARGRRARGG